MLRKVQVALVEAINMTWETQDGVMEYVCTTEMCTVLNVVKLKGICIGFNGGSLRDLKKFLQLNSSLNWRLFK